MPDKPATSYWRPSKEKLTANSRRWRSLNPERAHILSRVSSWKQYGITNNDGSPFGWNDYLKLLEIADNKCMACNSSNPGPNDWCVDHIHGVDNIGPAVGILCQKCNVLEGQYQKAIRNQALMDYIKKHKNIGSHGAVDAHL